MTLVNNYFRKLGVNMSLKLGMTLVAQGIPISKIKFHGCNLPPSLCFRNIKFLPNRL